MSPAKKLTLLYVVTLSIAIVAILGILRCGSALPVPAAASGAVPAAVHAETAPVNSVTGALTSGIQANLAHPLSRLLVQLLVVIGCALLARRVCRRVGQPAVVGEIVAGILLGPSLLGLLVPEVYDFVFPADSLGTLKLLSQVGVCLFMFVVGMELDVAKLQKNSQVAIAVSHVSIALPYLLGVLLAYFLYSDLAGAGTSFTSFALFTGISLSITAFPVLARILQERAMSRTFLGSTAMTCAAIDDVTAWTILAFVVAIAGASSLLAFSFNTMLVVAFLALMLFGVRRALPHLLGKGRIEREEPSQGALAIVIGVVMAASLATEVIGVHALFGAFLAGAVMPNVQEFRQKIGTRIQGFTSVLLLPLFFAFTGLRTQIGLIDDLQGWLLVLLITFVATAGKLGGSAAAARFAGMPWSDSLKLGALMNTRGLMELIVLNIGYDLGILSPRIFTMLVIMAVLTTMMTGPLLALFGRQSYRVGEGLQAPSHN